MVAIAILAAAWGESLAASVTEPTTVQNAITGTMRIDFGTRTNLDETGKVPEGSPALGAKDVYRTNLEVLQTTLIQGRVERQPWLPTKRLGVTAQQGYLAYDLAVAVRNPSDLSQSKVIGKWAGAMTLDGKGVYRLDEAPEGYGTLRIATDSFGSATGFVSEFGGTIAGRVPARAGLWGLADRTVSKVTKVYQRNVNGKIIKHTVEGADPMKFDRVRLAKGPLPFYPEATLAGSIDYDPEEGIWYVDIETSYKAGGALVTDQYDGTIRWNEDPNRESNGKGAYELNVRLNEHSSESDWNVFSGEVELDENSFFRTDNSVPGFTGTVSYVDTFDSDGAVVKSDVTYAVHANEASKVQIVNFAKVLLLMVGPFNDE